MAAWHEAARAALARLFTRATTRRRQPALGGAGAAPDGH